jgi:VanZ family protein
MIKILKKNILSIITALAILYLSFAPSDTFNEVNVFNLPYIDKAVHFCMYFGLTIVLLYENRSTVKNDRGLFLLSIIPFVYGTSIEFLQSWFTVTRKGDFFDAVFNLAGILFALMAWRLFLRFSKRKEY